MTDLYSEQQTGMRFSVFPLLVPHKHVPGHPWAGAGSDLFIEGLPERTPLTGSGQQGSGSSHKAWFLRGVFKFQHAS